MAAISLATRPVITGISSFQMLKLWVKLGGNQPTLISTNDCEIVDDFIKAVKKEFPTQLGLVPIDCISISTIKRGNSLKRDDILPASNTAETLLYIETIVGNPDNGFIASKSHSKREKRLEKMKAVLTKKKFMDSAKCSYDEWAALNSALITSKYVQPLKKVPDEQFKILSEYLSLARRSFGPITTNPTCHLIAPILVCVASACNARIEQNVNLQGSFAQSSIHFDFVLCRGHNKVFIIDAKNHGPKRGTAQALIGCEIAAKHYNLDKVFGIATNYVAWIYLHCLDDKIEIDEQVLQISPNGPSQESLLKITGKIYSILAQD